MAGMYPRIDGKLMCIRHIVCNVEEYRIYLYQILVNIYQTPIELFSIDQTERINGLSF